MFPLSVIIPSFNRTSQLDKTLHSLTEQSQTDFHILLVDHGSTENIEAVYQKYQDALHITYYRIARDEADSSGVPRDFGIRKAETPLVLSVDCGMILPSQYIEAHIAFHRLHPNYVGLGLQLGYDLQDNPQQAESAKAETTFLSQSAIQQAYIALKEGQMPDQRQGVKLEDLSLPWILGWTANLSLPRAAYLASGGFDLDLKGWGFEDVDLSYRLSKQGLSFGFVEDGWGIELPQPRQPMRERLESSRRNMLQGYWKQRTLALESLLLTQTLAHKAMAAYYARAMGKMDNAMMAKIGEQMRSQFIQQPEDIFHHLSSIGQQITALPILPEQMRAQFARPILLVGGTFQDAEQYDYVTLADEGQLSTPTTWSCCGVLIPLADQTLETVVVSDLWQKLDWSIEYPFGVRMSLFEILISEIHRTAKKAVFLHSPSVSSEHDGVSIATLENMCQQYKLAFEIVSPVASGTIA